MKNNKLTKSRQNLYRKPQTRDTLLPKIHPRVSIHLNVPKTPQSLSILPSSLFTLSVSLGAHGISSDLMSATPTFHLSIISSPVWLTPCPVVPGHWFRSVPSLYSLVAETEGGGGGRRRKGTKDTVKGVRLRAGGGGGWRRDRLPTEEALSSPLTGKKSEDARNPPLLHHLPFATPSPRSSTVANKEAGFRRRRDLSTSGTAN